MSTGSRIVKFDMVIGGAAILTGLMMALSMGVQGSSLIAGVSIALLIAVLAAIADRTSLGIWLFAAVSVLAVVALVMTGIEPWIEPVVSVGLLGVGIGQFLNRMLFGVVGSVPESRVKRGL